MGRKSKPTPRAERKGKDNGKKFKKKPCIFCKDRIDFVDYKDVNLLRRFMSDRAKIRARRVTGNCTQHQRDVALAIKLSRELALLPYAVRVTSSRGGGRGGGRGDRGERPARDERPPRPGPGDAPPPVGGVSGHGAGGTDVDIDADVDLATEEA
jgi:small subunit ribosomal protein S18